jgi:hypothetical protein
VDRRSGVGAALFTQVLPFFDQRVIELLVGFEQAVYANTHPPVPGRLMRLRLGPPRSVAGLAGELRSRSPSWRR